MAPGSNFDFLELGADGKPVKSMMLATAGHLVPESVPPQVEVTLKRGGLRVSILLGADTIVHDWGLGRSYSIQTSTSSPNNN